MVNRFVVIAALIVLGVVFHGTCQAGEPVKAPYSGPVWKPSDGMKGIVFRTNGDERVLGEKRRILWEHLTGKYKMGKPPDVGKGSGVYVETGVNGGIHRVILHGEMKVPGFKMKGTTDDDYRAAARAFLNEEKELFGLVNVDEDLKETEIRVSPNREEDIYGICCRISYQRYVEGIIVKYSRFGVALKKNGTIKGVDTDIVPITPDMREAAKRFKTEGGVTVDEVKDIISADYEERKTQFEYERPDPGFDVMEIQIIEKAPYVALVTVYRGIKYTVDVFAGKVLEAQFLPRMY